MSMLTGPCPECGKGLQIPEDLEEFSCLYCGARLTRDALLTDGSDQAFEKLASGLGPCVTGWPDTVKYLMPKKYDVHYKAYKESCEEVLKALNDLPRSRQEALADVLLDHIARWVEETKRPLTSADALLEDVKYTICLLFVPAVRQLAPWQGLPFCQVLRQKWLARWPKQKFQLTTYEDISGGFDRKKLCFITTAVCDWQGKPDNCAELTAFRRFRDDWLQSQSDGPALIARYYAIAPGIVTAIDLTDPDTVYPAIWQDHLRPCYDAIRQGNNAACKTRYTAMVTDLAKRYLKS